MQTLSRSNTTLQSCERPAERCVVSKVSACSQIRSLIGGAASLTSEYVDVVRIVGPALGMPAGGGRMVAGADMKYGKGVPKYGLVAVVFWGTPELRITELKPIEAFFAS